MVDGFAPIGWLDAVVPFHSPYRPLWLGLGAVATDLLIALVVTSLLRGRIGYRAWRAVHWTAYACWPVALVHGLGTGTDTKLGWVLVLYLGSLLAVVAAVWWRLAEAWRPAVPRTDLTGRGHGRECGPAARHRRLAGGRASPSRVVAPSRHPDLGPGQAGRWRRRRRGSLRSGVTDVTVARGTGAEQPRAPSGAARLLMPTDGGGLAAHVGRLGARPSGSRALISEIARSGLRGRGGAGFPTAVKLKALAGGRRPIVVANGTEGEPLSAKDKTLLLRSPHLVLDGLALVSEAVGASMAYVCIDRSATRVASAVDGALAERRAAGIDRVAVELRLTPTRYVVGEESALVHWLNGGDAKPTTTPPRPFERGVGGRPTVVHNVETLAQVGLIARFGADWFCQAGTRAEPGTVLLTVGGAVERPGVYEVGLGSPLTTVLGSAGVAETSVAVLLGGYFGTLDAGDRDRAGPGRCRAAARRRRQLGMRRRMGPAVRCVRPGRECPDRPLVRR